MSTEALSSSLWPAGLSRDLEPCFLASPLKFRHARVKVDCLHAFLQAGVGSLKLTLVEYSTPSHIAFIFSQWQLPAVGCSSQLFTLWGQLVHNKFRPVLFLLHPVSFLRLYYFFLSPFFHTICLTTLPCSVSHFIYGLLFVLLLFSVFPAVTLFFLPPFIAAFEQPASWQCQASRVPAMILL